MTGLRNTSGIRLKAMHGACGCVREEADLDKYESTMWCTQVDVKGRCASEENVAH